MVAFLIDYLLPNFHLIITSQVYPPLQIPRLRTRRELLEIGPEDLHCSQLVINLESTRPNQAQEVHSIIYPLKWLLLHSF
jgi:hypothetical protein